MTLKSDGNCITSRFIGSQVDLIIFKYQKMLYIYHILYSSWIGCTKAGYCYPPDSEFFQLPQQGIKSSDTKNIDTTRDRK